MPRHKIPVLMGVLMLALGAGCIHSHEACCKPTQPPPPPEVTLSIVSRGHMETLFHGLPGLIPDEALPGSAQEVIGTYYALSSKDCQCLAARCCGVANLLDLERRAATALSQSKCFCCGPKALKGSDFVNEILDSAALDGRNQQAGAALELYYRLTEAEAGADLLQMTIQELDSAVARVKALAEKIFTSPEDIAKVERQRYQAISERVELLMNIETLNIEIGKLVCVRICAGEAHFWPLVDLEAGCPAIDPETAVRVALQNRSELQILRVMLRELDLMTLPAIRQGLKSIHALLGTAQPQCKCPELQILLEMLCKDGPNTRELPIRRQQLVQRIAEREQAIAADVVEEIRHIHRRCQLATLAKKRSDSLAKSVSEVEERVKKGVMGTPEDVTKARLEWLLSRSNVVKEIAARERAKVKLKQHQGILPLECPEPSPSGHCPN